jgi:orotate phosphoribosyltransferase
MKSDTPRRYDLDHTADAEAEVASLRARAAAVVDGYRFGADFAALLESCGAVIRDSHVVYTSGRHGSAYVNKDAIYPHPRVVSRLCEWIATEFRHAVEIVASPAVGGVILSQWTAYHLGRMDGGDRVLAVYAEKAAGGGFEFQRGYDKFIAGRKVLIVEDIVTTGGTLRDVSRAVVRAGGTIVGVVCLVNRGGVASVGGGSAVPLFSLATLALESFDPAACPLCRAGVPINTEVGKGREFLARGGR